MHILMLTDAQSIKDRREGSTNYFTVCLLACSFSKPKMSSALADHPLSKNCLIG